MLPEDKAANMNRLRRAAMETGAFKAEAASQ
jgi:hypothetical protein